ncbi:MAG: BlaI/MecI/CopY family transcriptional regulator [Cellulosilyticum sp.]|nr:BlaI/MecI/CopY family transcriptional regulator [Cellulosilyticum sp.]
MKFNITDSEWKVMKVLWEQSPLSLKEIVASLKEETSWSNTTVRTLIVRLMEKKYIEADKSTGNFKYAPLIAKEVCQKEEAKDFLDRVFEGSMGMFITAFMKKGKLTKKDEEELKKLIEKIEEE